jgi:hypothetical protein
LSKIGLITFKIGENFQGLGAWRIGQETRR